jgi:hypothetical protein
MSEFFMDDMDAIDSEIGRLKAQRDELLDMCQKLLAAFIDKKNGYPDDELYASPEEIIRQAEAVIAKAEGRTHA